MFTKDYCPKCDWDEAFFDKLASEERGYFLFAKMNVDKNLVTADYRPHLYDLKDGKPMLQYLVILPDGAQLKRFQKDRETYDEFTQWTETVEYLIQAKRTEL